MMLFVDEFEVFRLVDYESRTYEQAVVLIGVLKNKRY